MPQPDVAYGISHKGTAFVPRKDGFVFQVVGDSGYYGWGIETAVPIVPKPNTASEADLTRPRSG